MKIGGLDDYKGRLQETKESGYRNNPTEKKKRNSTEKKKNAPNPPGL